jgi:holo-[acyl-carrier protein] synthase
MIIGIGNDYTDIRRIQKSLEKFGSKFTERVFTEKERKRAESKGSTNEAKAASYAKRWAAKEACGKALGTGIANGVRWQDIEITNLSSGKPVISLYGKALEKLNELVPNGMSAKIDVTLTDDFPKAAAVVIISAE